MSAIELADFRSLARRRIARRRHRRRGASRCCSPRRRPLAPRQGQRGAALLPRGAPDRRRRRLGEHLVGHVRAHRVDARPPTARRRPRRARALLGHRLPGASARDTGVGARGSSASSSSPARAAGLQPQPPRSPWTSSFSAGTRISTGLSLASTSPHQDRVHKPVVLLVSDLDDDAGDLESLTSVGLAYRKLGIPINVVGLNPSPEDTRFIERLLPSGGKIQRAALPEQRSIASRTGFPTALALLAVALAPTLASCSRSRSGCAGGRLIALRLWSPLRCRRRGGRAVTRTTYARGAPPSSAATRASRTSCACGLARVHVPSRRSRTLCSGSTTTSRSAVRSFVPRSARRAGSTTARPGRAYALGCRGRALRRRDARRTRGRVAGGEPARRAGDPRGEASPAA